MGFDDQCSWGFKSLIRKKKVNFHQGNVGEHLLAKELSVLHLTVIGVGATIGAGVYILVGTVAREHSGPALALSFLISGIAAALSAFCYAELAGRCPSAGSAYHYSYICVGEVAAWLTGWALILEYSLGGSAVARGVSPNLAEGGLWRNDKGLSLVPLGHGFESGDSHFAHVRAMFLGGDGSLPSILGRQLIPWLNVVIDPCAAILVFIVTGLLCLGIKESTLAQAIATSINVCVMVFVIITGAYLGFKTGWIGYELPSGFFPFGIDGMFAGSATVFFAYIGFDSLVSTAEEVRNPQRDLPLAIGAALSICCTLYMLVSSVVVGLVPYYTLDPDTPIATAFSSHGMQWAAYLIGVGTISALCSTLMGSLLPQPRLLMAMARDGLLPRLFADIDGTSLVPVKSTVVTGIGTATLAFFMDVPQLAGMVSVGTLIAFTMAAISILIVRYVPPPSSLRGRTMETERRHHHNDHHCHDESACISTDQPLIVKDDGGGLFALSQKRRRWIAGWTIFSTCTGILVLTSGASGLGLSRYLRFGLCGAGGAILLSGLTVLTCIDQDDGQHRFGHVGGFICPMVPLLPILCILVNVYLLINLGVLTWLRVSAWLLVGIGVYALYGREHSLLHHADGAAAVRLHL